jgi:phage terminase large subunit-like protein
MPKNEAPLSPAELLLQFERGLQQVAIAPGIDAYKPHASQEKFHRSTAKGKLYIGGNRSGKTVGGGTEAVMRLTGKHRYRSDLPIGVVRGRMVTVDIEEGIKKIAIPEILKWMPSRYLQDGSWDKSYDKQSRTLTLTNGSSLEFMSYEQAVEKFAGTSRHFVWFDEEPPKEIFSECMMRLVDTDGDWWITMTPLIVMSWTKDEIYDPVKDNQRDDVYVLEVNTEENPHINIGALDRLTVGLSESEKQARRAGTYISHTGRIYGPTCFSSDYAKEGGNVIEDALRYHDIWRTLLQYEHFAMWDHGLNNPTAILFACYDTEGRIFVYDELYINDMVIRQYANIFLNRVKELGIDLQYIVGDPAIQNRLPNSGTSIQTEYAECGINIALGNNDVRAGITRVQGRFAKRMLFISERCTNTLRERENYRWDRYASSKIEARRNARDQPLKRNDHAMDALRYGVCSRPAMDEEVDIPFSNVLGLPVAISPEFDWHKMYPAENASPVYDDILGAEW